MTVTTVTAPEKAKKISRTKKAETIETFSTVRDSVQTIKPLSLICDFLSELIVRSEQAKKEMIDLQGRIVEVQKIWTEEQKQHEKEVTAGKAEEELVRRRENEEYEYQVRMERRKNEDEFNERKTVWEKELQQRKDEIAAEKKELVELRAKVASFDAESLKTTKETQAATAKELEEKYANERKLREQEVKSEKEILNLKIVSLAAENSRQAGEIQALKAAFDEATRQLKDIAVKVIEGRTPKVIDSSEV